MTGQLRRPAELTAAVTVTVTGLLVGAGVGGFLLAVSPTYAKLCDDSPEGFCMFGQVFMAVIILGATVAFAGLLMLIVLAAVKIRPRVMPVAASFLVPLPLIAVFVLTEFLGDYRILLTAAVSGVLQAALAVPARVRFPDG